MSVIIENNKMMNDNDNKSPLDDIQLPQDQEKITQQALGNTTIENPEESDKTLPKTTGTGSNPSSAAPSSVIIHENDDDQPTDE